MVIVSCGDAIIDLMPNPIPGGSNLNAAVAAARLGGPTAFAGRISYDDYGEMLLKHMADSGVDLRLVERGTEPTARSIVQTEPTPSFRFEADGTAEANLSSVDLDLLEDGPHIIHGGTFGMYRGRTAATLFQLIRSEPGLVSLDPNVRPTIVDDRRTWDMWHDHWIEHTSLYRCSDEDLAWIWHDRTTESVAEDLLNRGVEAVVVTGGSAGCRVFTADWSQHVPAVLVDVVDTVGAGDTFTGALLTGLHGLGVNERGGLTTLARGPFMDVIQTALIAAAIVCTRVGANPPWKEELDTFRAGLASI